MFRKSEPIPLFATYIFPLVFTLITSGILYLFNGALEAGVLAMALLIPVSLSAAWWGLSQGILGAIASFLAFNYLFIQPYGSFYVNNPEDWFILFAFLAAAILISELVGRARQAVSSARQKRNEAIRLFELSTLLAGLADFQGIARTLSQKVLEAIGASQVETLIEASPPVIARSSINSQFTPSRPDIVIPIENVRGLAGEIRIWHKQLLEDDDRLLKVFASLGVQAIERVRLAESASKAKVLEESDRLKTSLLSSVSHELRSPLAAIKASVSSLRSGDVDWESEARAELLATMEEEIDHLNVLVGNLLDMSRIEAGVLKPQKKPNMLSEIVGAVTHRMKHQFLNHQLVVNVSDELPMVNVDFVQMQQVITNLLGNSLKYSPPSSTIRLDARQMDSTTLLVTVANQSIPLPETDIDRIFDKFYRINPSERITGAGLGLSICKGIVEAHGNKIWAENISNGTAFHFTLSII